LTQLLRHKWRTAEDSDYTKINTFLKGFFGRDGGGYEREIRVYSLIQFIDITPDMVDDTIFTRAPTWIITRTMLYGLQGPLMICSLCLFSLITIETESASIAAFVVFLIDFIVITLCRVPSRSDLMKNALLNRLQKIVHRHFLEFPNSGPFPRRAR
jgi:hypothetical protein